MTHERNYNMMIKLFEFSHPTLVDSSNMAEHNGGFRGMYAVQDDTPV